MIHLLYCNSIKSCYSTEREFEIVTLCNSLSLRPFMKLSVYVHRRKMSDWSTRDHVTLPNSKWRQYLHRLFIPVERRLIAA